MDKYYNIGVMKGSLNSGWRLCKSFTFFIFCFCISVTQILKAQVTVDAVSSAQTAAASTTLSWSHTTTSSQNNRLLIVTVQADGSNTVSGITYGGTALTLGKAKQQGTNIDAEIWYLMNPASGTNNVTITHSASKNLIGGSITFYNVNQSGTFGTFVAAAANAGSPTGVNTSSTFPTANDLIVDAVATLTKAATVGGAQTQRWNRTQTAGFTSGATSTLPGSGASQTMQWTYAAGSDKWAAVCVPIFNCTPPAAGGTASLTTTPINEGDAAQLNLSGHTSSGTTVQWQSSTDNVTFTDISGGTGTPYTTSPIAFEGTYYYRARVYDNTTLCFVYSTTTTLTVNSSKCSITGTSVFGAGAVTIGGETKYVANDNILIGNVTMNDAASAFRINDVCAGSVKGSWTGKFAADPTAGSQIYVYGSINNSTDWTIGGGGAVFNIYSTGSITINRLNINGAGNYTFNNYGTISTTGDFKLTGNGRL